MSECCVKPLSGQKTLKSVPSPQRRSWWHTPTAAQSLSASPWCLCRSQCHRASTYSTSPESDRSKCFISTCAQNCILIAMHLNKLLFHIRMSARYNFPIKVIATLHLPSDMSVSETFLWSQDEICFVLVSTPGQGPAVNGNLAYRRWAHSHIITFSFPSIMWKWV